MKTCATDEYKLPNLLDNKDSLSASGGRNHFSQIYILSPHLKLEIYLKPDPSCFNSHVCVMNCGSTVLFSLPLVF